MAARRRTVSRSGWRTAPATGPAAARKESRHRQRPVHAAPHRRARRPVAASANRSRLPRARGRCLMTASRCRQKVARATIGAALRAGLPVGPASARESRSAIRRALIAWGMDELAGDAELLTSELVANAAEYADGDSIRLALRREAAACGQRGITCEVSDTSPVLPEVRAAGARSRAGTRARHRRRARYRQRRASQPTWQDQLVHPRPFRPCPPPGPPGRTRA